MVAPQVQGLASFPWTERIRWGGPFAIQQHFGSVAAPRQLFSPARKNSGRMDRYRAVGPTQVQIQVIRFAGTPAQTIQNFTVTLPSTGSRVEMCRVRF
jgi:hypothetical protein